MISRLNSHTLRNKFLIILMFISILSAFVTAGVLIYFESEEAEKEQENKLVLISSIIGPSLTAAILFEDIDTIKELIEPTVKTSGIFATYVYDKQNNQLSFIHKKSIFLDNLKDENQLKIPLELDNDVYGTLIFYIDRSVIDKKMSFYKKLVAQLLVGTLFISFILSLVLSRIITTPLSSLINIAKKVNNSNNYTIRAPFHSADEIGDLTKCFNTMLDTVENRERILESKVIARTKALEEANQQLHHQAFEDTLSGLPNRRSLYAHLNKQLEHKNMFCLLFIDLDGFKQINDSLGHDYGDILLQHTSQRILNCVRANDFVARLGGDEFTVVLNDLTEKTHIDRIINKILESLSSAFFIKNENVYASASIGATICPQDSNNVDTLIKNADQAMYESKRSGKNQAHYFNQAISQQLNNKKEKISDLHRAITNEEFVVFYQPIVNLRNNRIEKAEALIRWQHPTKGLIYPDEFLTTLEEEDMMDNVGYWVANKVLQDRLRWQKMTATNINVSVNISPSQFTSKNNKLALWLDNIKRLQLPIDAISVEITEHSLVQDSRSIHSILNEIHNKNIQIAVDDFGVGYSSLSYLQQLNVDILKIDRSFIQKLSTDKRSFGLCKGIITIAQELGLTIIAEGVEEQSQHELIVKLDCHYGQGYLYGKPVPRDKFESKYFNQYDLFDT